MPNGAAIPVPVAKVVFFFVSYNRSRGKSLGRFGPGPAMKLVERGILKMTKGRRK